MLTGGNVEITVGIDVVLVVVDVVVVTDVVVVVVGGEATFWMDVGVVNARDGLVLPGGVVA